MAFFEIRRGVVVIWPCTYAIASVHKVGRHLLRALPSEVLTEEGHLALHLRQGYGAQSRASFGSH
jgi:hypothetical protein